MGRGSTAGNGAAVPPTVFFFCHLPAEFCASEPLRLSGIVATTGTSTSACVFKDDLAAAFVSTEGKIAGMLTSMAQDGKKWKHSPSPDSPPVVEEEEWVALNEKAVRIELEGQLLDSTSEEEV